MNKVALHIGMHKTGTSSIQRALSNLDCETHFFPHLVCGINHSIAFYTAYSKNYMDYHITIKHGLSKQAAKERRFYCQQNIEEVLSLDQNQTIIFSGEDIVFLEDEEVSSLAALMRKYTDKIDIYAYFRTPLDYIISNFQECVKGGTNVINRPNYRYRFAKFIDQFGGDNVHFRPYNNLKNDDVVEDFCDWLNIPGDLKKITQENVSLSTESTKFLYLLNQSNCLTHGDHNLNHAHALLIQKLQFIFPGKFHLPYYLLEDKLDYDDIKWMEDATGHKLQIEPSEQEHKYNSIPDFMTDISQEAIDKIISFLNKENISSNYRRLPDKLINRLFYWCIAQYEINNHDKA